MEDVLETQPPAPGSEVPPAFPGPSRRSRSRHRPPPRVALGLAVVMMLFLFLVARLFVAAQFLNATLHARRGPPPGTGVR